jgi:hypothetical protein
LSPPSFQARLTNAPLGSSIVLKDRRCRSWSDSFESNAIGMSLSWSSDDASPAARLLRFYRKNSDPRMIPETCSTHLASLQSASGPTNSRPAPSPPFRGGGRTYTNRRRDQYFFYKLSQNFFERSVLREGNRLRILLQSRKGRQRSAAAVALCRAAKTIVRDFCPVG